MQAVQEQSRLNALQKAQQQDERIKAATGSTRSRGAGVRSGAVGVWRLLYGQACFPRTVLQQQAL
jgi:hypothetical protein